MPCALSDDVWVWVVVADMETWNTWYGNKTQTDIKTKACFDYTYIKIKPSIFNIEGILKISGEKHILHFVLWCLIQYDPQKNKKKRKYVMKICIER